MPIGRACISVHREAAMAHGPLDSVPDVVSALCWHESFEHAADAAPDALDVLRADSGSMLRVFAALLIL